MSDLLGILVASGGAAWEVPLLHALQRRELGIRVVRRCVEHGELLGTALRDRPAAVVVDAGLPWFDRDFVATLRGAGVVVIALGDTASELEAVGVERLDASVPAEVLAGVVHSRHRPAATVEAPVDAAAPAAVGRLVTCWGAAGAPGRTTVAVHLAIEACRTGIRTLLVDADVWAASVAQRLDLPETPSLTQAAEMVGTGRAAALADHVHERPDGLSVLPGLPRAELWPEVREHAWRALLAAALASFELVVVDVAAPVEDDEDLVVDHIPYRRNLVTTIALERADRIVQVVDADPIGLRRAVVARRSATERLVSVPTSTVLNRVPRSPRRAQDCSRAISAWLGGTPSALLPAEPAFDRVVWEGRPLHAVAPRSRWLRELRAWVPEVVA